MRDWVLVAIVAVVVLWLAAAIGRWRRSRTAKRRGARAVRGEGAAARLLEEAGYAVVGSQVRTAWELVVDGEVVEIELRADYVVERGGERLVAEVKTGEAAPSLATAATRRQLLEYRVAFAVDGVLLVVPEAGAIHRVEFAMKNLPVRRPAADARSR